jgi:hypothetical protein
LSILNFLAQLCRSFVGRSIAIEPAIFASNPTIYVTNLRPKAFFVPSCFFVTPKTFPLI